MPGEISRDHAAPTCPYCAGEAYCVTGDILFQFNPEKHSGRFWQCIPCKAWVPAGPDGLPMGTLADAVLRSQREMLRPMLTELAERKKAKGGTLGDARQALRNWLAPIVGVKKASDVMIDYMDLEQCRAAIKAAEPFVKRVRA